MAYRNRNTGRLHLALVMGEIDGDVLTLVRVQPARSISDIVNLLRVDATDRIHYALARIQKEGRGVLVYLQADMMEEKSFNLAPEAERQRGSSGPGRTSSAGLREYGIGAQILADLGLRRIRIMTNEERRIVALEGYGLELEERVPVDLEPELPALRLLGTSRDTSYLQRH
ncbi:MAG: hypothetical protein O2807_05380 [bacterium]|nr:hypothetical protein [bacterium]